MYRRSYRSFRSSYYPCKTFSSSTVTPSQLREWYAGRGRSGGAGPCTYVLRTGTRSGEVCGLPHTTQRCFAGLTDAWRTQIPDAVDLPHWHDLLLQNVPIIDLDFDAILAAMYAHADINEGDCYRRVPPDPGTVAAALGASASAAPGACAATALGASASAAPGAGTSPPSGTPPTASFHIFTLDSNASRSFSRDSTTLTPLSRPVAVSLADPSGGPVLAHSSTVLPCLAASSGFLSGLHLLSFSTNLVSGADLRDAWVDQFTPGGQRVTHCTCSRTGRHLATFTRRPRSSLYTLTTVPPPISTSNQVAASSQVFAVASRSLPPLPPGPAPTCVPCVEGRQRAAPHSSSFPPTEAPLQTLHMDVCGPARVRGQGHKRYFLLVVDDYSRYTTVFPLCSKGEVTEVLIDWIRGARRQLSESFGSDLPVLRLHSDRGGEFCSDLLRAFCRLEGICQTFTLPASPQQNGIAERRIGMVMDVARTSMIHAAAPHFMWPFAVQYAAHQINLQPRVSLPETTPTLRWTGKVGDASAFRDVTFDESVSYYGLFPYRTASPPPPPLFLAPDPAESVEVAVDSGAASGGAAPAGAESGGAHSGRAEPGGAALGTAGASRGAAGAGGAAGAAGGAAGGATVVLTGHADASWVDDLATQRSSQGYTFSIGSGSVSWRSTRSSSVLSSSCEAEIYAGAMAAQELRWLTYLLADLGEAPRSPLVLYIDNKAMPALCQEHRLEHRTNHIALRYFLVRELQQRGQLRLTYVASQANTADVFTKALQPCDHQHFCTVLCGDFVIHPEFALLFLTGLRPLGPTAAPTAAIATADSTAAPACWTTMALLRVLALIHEGRLVQFDMWLDDLQLYLLSDSKNSVSLFDLASGAAMAPPATADSATRSQWLTRDAAARLAIRNNLPLAECAHFGQHRTAQALYDAVVTRYSLPATAALGRLLLPYLFPELSAFTTVEDLVSHLRTSNARYRATVPAEFLDRNQPPMFITLYFIVTRLPDSLRFVRDQFLSLHPTSLTVDLLEQHLLAAETSAVATSLLLRTSGLLLLVRSAAAAKARVARVVEVAAVVVEVAAGVVVGAAVEVVEVVEVVAAVGLVAGVGALVAAVEAAVGVAAVEAVGLDLGVEALVVASGNSSSVGARPSRPSSSTCGKLHTQHRCFSRLNDAWRAEFGDEVERPCCADLHRSRVAIFDLDFDAILSAMYALSSSAEGDCYRCVPPDPGIAAAALGASESGCHRIEFSIKTCH
ncbi:unnamed protein product [Closterium sp. NIES-53]